MPSIDGATSATEEASELLRKAAEIEHGLLVQYLYAAWSLDASASVVRDAIVDVAVQEMAHLITVQNLTLILGNEPYFGREDQFPDPAIDPFPFALEPFSKSLCERFLITEMPALDDLSASRRAMMEAIIERLNETVSRKLHRVGLIYAKLYWLFQAGHEPTPPWDAVGEISDLGVLPDWHIQTFAGTTSADTFQANTEDQEWKYATSGREGVFARVGSREDALQAIFDIAVQGEGLADGSGISHFHTFAGIYDGLDDLPSSSFLPFPTNPFTADDMSGDPAREANRVSDRIAARLCKLFDLRYSTALASLRTCLAFNRSKPSEVSLRSQFTSWALEEMISAMRPLANRLKDFPLKEHGTPGERSAAPTFRIAFSSLPSGPAELQAIIKDLHEQSSSLLRELQNENLDIATRNVLRGIEQIDARRYPIA